VAFFTGPIAATTIPTLLESLQGFLTTAGAGNPGWTNEAAGGATEAGVDTTNGEWAVSKDGTGTHYVQIAGQWDPASPEYLGLYHYYDTGGAGSYVDGNSPWGQTNDSGNGYSGGTITNNNLDNERYVLLTADPIRYWCFTDDQTGEPYAHIVVETGTGVYVHFGFGVLDKFNDWTGGEYCYGHRVGAGQHMSSSDTSLMFDARLNGTGDQDFACTMRIEGMTDTPASGRWGVAVADGQGTTQLGTDSAAVDRIHLVGGVRGGMHNFAFGTLPGTISTGYVTSAPVVVYHIDRNVSGSSATYVNSFAPLGAMKDVRTLNIENFEPGDVVTIGSDDWYIFPWSRKSPDATTSNGYSGYAGVMYKANT